MLNLRYIATAVIASATTFILLLLLTTTTTTTATTITIIIITINKKLPIDSFVRACILPIHLLLAYTRNKRSRLNKC